MPSIASPPGVRRSDGAGEGDRLVVAADSLVVPLVGQEQVAALRQRVVAGLDQVIIGAALQAGGGQIGGHRITCWYAACA